jgi:hypothetical protein
MSSNWKALVGGCVVGALCVGAGMSGSGDATPVALTASPVVWNQHEGNHWRLFRQWSDGSVDCFRITFENAGSCEIMDMCSVQVYPPSCPGDVNHDGNIETDDLLDLLGAWGPCE